MPEPIPDNLELVRSFVNTIEMEPTGDIEELVSPDALVAWMESAGIPLGEALGERDLHAAIEFREALRALLVANSGGRVDEDAITVLRDAADEGLIRVQVDGDGRAVPQPAAPGVRALYARLLAAIADAQAAGTWERMKACASDTCQWAFYDSSKNRSRTWCSMEVCGNRAKTRAYRKRKKQ